MDDLTFIVSKLKNMNLRKVSRQVPLHYQTIYKIANGQMATPTYKTVKILKDFLMTV